jgi:excisionase family DNA binding protein
MTELLTLEQVADELTVGRTTAHKLIRSGAIASVKIGKSRRVSRAALQDYITANTAGGPALLRSAP